MKLLNKIGREFTGYNLLESARVSRPRVVTDLPQDGAPQFGIVYLAP